MTDADPLRHLSEQHTRLGERINVVERIPFGAPLLILIGLPPEGTVHAVGIELVAARSVQVDQ